uniref:WD_REPEATS_REGION domain-containing protein n=1 Tax=Heterorhabditis bacteriophora TaxID=37862 RepID=A0A1I7XGB7_HETBA
MFQQHSSLVGTRREYSVEYASSWVTCRFSPHSEHLLYLGDDDGNVGIVDVRSVYGSAIDAKAGVLQIIILLMHFLIHVIIDFAAHKGTITDVMGVPRSPNELLSISGDTNVRIWDLQREKSTLYFGHDMTVRSASFAPDNPHTFVTGGRDGQIRLWDTRTSYVRNRGQEVKKPVNVYRNAHVTKGVTSLCLDRFGSSLFAAVTDNYVYEYAVTTTNTMPIRHFSGATIESFYVQVNASPICDQIICGSTNNQAVVWDLQDFHKFLDDSCDVSMEKKSRAHLPKFSLNGHNREVTSVGWSAGGTYMVSMDDDCFRIWSPGDASNESYIESRLIQFERIEPYKMTCSEKTTAMVDGDKTVVCNSKYVNNISSCGPHVSISKKNNFDSRILTKEKRAIHKSAQANECFV